MKIPFISIIVLLFILFVGGIVYGIHQIDQEKKSKFQNLAFEQTQHYENKQFDFAFTYPTKYHIVEISPASFSVGYTSSEKFHQFVEIGIYTLKNFHNINDHVTKQIFEKCEQYADGQKIKCQSIRSDNVYISDFGISGREVHINGQSLDPEGIDTYTDIHIGPYYAFRLQSDKVVIISPTKLGIRENDTQNLQHIMAKSFRIAL